MGGLTRADCPGSLMRRTDNPGPMQSGMLDMFVDRKHGREEVAYDHPLMESMLKDTYARMGVHSSTEAAYMIGLLDGANS